MEPLIFVAITFFSAGLSIPVFRTIKKKVEWKDENVAGLVTILGIVAPLGYGGYLLEFKSLVYNLFLIFALPYGFYLGKSNYRFFSNRKTKGGNNQLK